MLKKCVKKRNIVIRMICIQMQTYLQKISGDNSDDIFNTDPVQQIIGNQSQRVEQQRKVPGLDFIRKLTGHLRRDMDWVFTCDFVAVFELKWQFHSVIIMRHGWRILTNYNSLASKKIWSDFRRSKLIITCISTPKFKEQGWTKIFRDPKQLKNI